ncbi:MAG: hypothetical protein ABIG67_02545 [Pseudomonadota bacterium]
MKKRILIYLVSLIITLFTASLVMAAEVAQGKCINYDKEKKIITMEEYGLKFSDDHPYGNPTGVELVFNVEKAQIGLAPQPGDILRIAYKIENGEKRALKVMNVSKQDLRKK